MTVRVSVVVPTCRRPEFLSRCIEALLAQDFDPEAFEIIIVNDGADDDSRRVVDAWQAFACHTEEPTPIALAPYADGNGNGHHDVAHTLSLHERARWGCPSIRYLPLHRRSGPAAARNAGWCAARGEIIAFTDDDCIPTPGWLRAGMAAFTDGVSGVSGRIVMPTPENPTDYELNASRLELAEFVTANCFYRRSAIDEAGGFDEHFTAAWREDSDLYFTLLEKTPQEERSTRFIHAPKAVVIHPVRPAPWGISLKQQNKNVFNALLFKKHPRLYTERLGPVRPLHYYLIVAALVLELVGILADQPGLTAAMGLVWIGATLQFALLRLRCTSRSLEHMVEMAVTSVLIPPVALYYRLRGALKYRVWFF